jgi:hypothetical protein
MVLIPKLTVRDRPSSLQHDLGRVLRVEAEPLRGRVPALTRRPRREMAAMTRKCRNREQRKRAATSSRSGVGSARPGRRTRRGRPAGGVIMSVPQMRPKLVTPFAYSAGQDAAGACRKTVVSPCRAGALRARRADAWRPSPLPRPGGGPPLRANRHRHRAKAAVDGQPVQSACSSGLPRPGLEGLRRASGGGGQARPKLALPQVRRRIA